MSIFEALQSEEPIGRFERRKLDGVEVSRIRWEYAQDPKPTQAALARNWGVSQPQISKIVNAKQWKGK